MPPTGSDAPGRDCPLWTVKVRGATADDKSQFGSGTATGGGAG
ncbi:hypothetical protein SAMN05444320_102557 [Streptoalloteichus hindustanus]|uniref:Uncharacterized protein n=1 Tax=Streptoalloteichus hindustanus TaxID=2017 RepID=A0A1M4Z1E9_STRHI|nr:hypothetical protein SAMN05444320_102557 [Streptoalloteichus hindustanus]